MSDLIAKSALDVVSLLRTEEVTPHDLLDALEQRIGEVDGSVNALPILCFDKARERADELSLQPVDQRGPLCGMPVAIKDLVDVAGVRSTQGSPIFSDHVPDVSDVLVKNLVDEGGIVYAKSNTPEFGAGANTFNEVFGATLNPWNTALSAAGSSGGAAVALATGMAWLAHGSDMGGSLRNPASFCGIVGMRPSPGRVASTPGSSIGNLLSVDGPMARNVEDVAFLLDVMSGAFQQDPLSKPQHQPGALVTARSGFKPRRIAVSVDLGITPVDPEVGRIVTSAAERLAGQGIAVEEAHPDLRHAHDCFQTLRALSFATSLKPLLEQHRDKLKPEVIWNIEKGLALTAEEIVQAENQRAEMFRGVVEFFQNYDALITPATIVPPFPVEQRYVESCNGQEFSNYVEWLAIAYAITNVACPALSLPAGFTNDNLPVGLQVVGPPQGDSQLLACASFIEQVLGKFDMVPIDPRG